MRTATPEQEPTFWSATKRSTLDAPPRQGRIPCASPCQRVDPRAHSALVDESSESRPDPDYSDEAARRLAELLEDGSLDPDELTDEPAWWDEGGEDET